MKNVIIVGAGLGGLCAGNLLARSGHRVTMFEAHSAPGGYTAGFSRKGYYFESGTINLEASASVFMAMRDIGVLGQIDFVKLKTRYLSEEFDGVPENYKEYKRMIYAGYPQEKEKLDATFTELDQIVGAMGNLDGPMPFMFTGMRFVKSMLPFLLSGPKLMKLAKRYGDMTSSEFAGRYFEKGSRLYRLFCGFSYPDMPTITMGGALASTFRDIWAVKGGMQSWADVLADNFRKLGGELRLKSPVDSIITKNGAAVGVICKGTIYEADAVISAADYKQTLLNLLDDKSLVPQARLEAIENAAVSEGFFTVYLGLAMTNEELGAAMKAPHVFACDEQPGCDIHNPHDADFFGKTSVSLYSPSMLNPGLAPEGKSSLMLQTMVPTNWMGNWGGGDRQEYKVLKERAAEELIGRTSAVIPALQDRIEYRDAATPLTYARFTRNTGGASSAWSWNPQKKFYRSFMDVNVQTPVKNLFIGSCWAMQNGGVPGAIAAAYHCAGKIG